MTKKQGFTKVEDIASKIFIDWSFQAEKI